MAQTFGKFTLLEQIGGGRFSQVFRVGRAGTRDPSGLALKRVHPSLIHHPPLVGLVVREAGLLARLEHTNLCALQEMGVVDGSAFLAVEMVDGCTLRALMRRTAMIGARLPASAVVAIAHQLATVLDYLHRSGPLHLVHLDLSPQNVMISRRGTVKLLDLGLARLLDQEAPAPLAGKVAGTIGYMSPEQARGEESLDARADQFGLGILMWEMLAGRRAFRGNRTETWERMRAGMLPPPGPAMAERPAALRELVGRLLAPLPADRFPDVAAMRQDLERSVGSPRSGVRPLAALVDRLMGDPGFDPFDAVNLRRPAAEVEEDASALFAALGQGSASYEDLSIAVDHGNGTPSAAMRTVLQAPDAPLWGLSNWEGETAPLTEEGDDGAGEGEGPDRDPDPPPSHAA